VKGDYGINKAVENLVPLEKNSGYTERYQNVQQTYWRRFWIEESSEAGGTTLRPNGKRIPGLKLDHARQLAV